MTLGLGLLKKAFVRGGKCTRSNAGKNIETTVVESSARDDSQPSRSQRARASTRTLETCAATDAGDGSITEYNPIELPFHSSTSPSTFYMDLVQQMADRKNQRDVSYVEMYQLGTKVSFGEMSIDMAIYYDVIHQCFGAFPDLHFHIDCMQPNAENERIVYAIVTVSGTHSGCAYHTPVYPTPIPTSHIHVEMDPEEWTVQFAENGKISQLHIRPLGKYSGPNGLYEKVQKGLKKRQKKQQDKQQRRKSNLQKKR